MFLAILALSVGLATCDESCAIEFTKEDYYSGCKKCNLEYYEKQNGQ